MQPAKRLGRPDYRSPVERGPASDPFDSSQRGRAGPLPPETAPPSVGPGPGPETYPSSLAPGVPPVFIDQSPQIPSPYGTPAPGADEPEEPTKPLSFFERHHWPLDLPARPTTRRVSVPLSLLGTVVGARPCAIVWDGLRTLIVGEGDSLTVQGRKVLFREIGEGHAQVIYDRRVHTLKLREGP